MPPRNISECFARDFAGAEGMGVCRETRREAIEGGEVRATGGNDNGAVVEGADDHLDVTFRDGCPLQPGGEADKVFRFFLGGQLDSFEGEAPLKTDVGELEGEVEEFGDRPRPAYVLGCGPNGRGVQMVGERAVWE